VIGAPVDGRLQANPASSSAAPSSVSSPSSSGSLPAPCGAAGHVYTQVTPSGPTSPGLSPAPPRPDAAESLGRLTVDDSEDKPGTLPVYSVVRKVPRPRDDSFSALQAAAALDISDDSDDEQPAD
jgi:hypothetical protein